MSLSPCRFTRYWFRELDVAEGAAAPLQRVGDAGIVAGAAGFELDERAVEMPVNLLDQEAKRPRGRRNQARGVEHDDKGRLEDGDDDREVEEDEEEALSEGPGAQHDR